MKIQSVFAGLCALLLAIPIAYSGVCYAHYWGMGSLPIVKILVAVAIVLGVIAFAVYRRKSARVGMKALFCIWCVALLMNLAGNAEVYGFLPQLPP